MAYYSGQAASYQEILNTLVAACTSQGWTWNNSVLSKDGIFLKLKAVPVAIVATGGTGQDANGSLLNTASVIPCIGNMGYLPQFPVTYHLFVFEQEVYLKVRFDIDGYYYLAFGKSSLPLPASGLWISGNTNYNWGSANNRKWIYVNENGGGYASQNDNICIPLPFWADFGGSYYYIHQSSTILCGLDDVLWSSSTKLALFVRSLSPHQYRQPSTWNSDTVLTPFSIFLQRPSDKISQVADFQNARYLRIDNYEPEQIIELGNEKWMVFPFYRKNITSRNGGQGIDHTGTFGWAIRYDGP
ncbi:hypothetical protein [Acinetobacter ursingii]|uniref:hypothetical protein n=1 Tax=Acinetobacter ursingii TaxID=108980 RepID=UPI0021D0D24F|nr:hypothetical protein [Acinetobacter ursingii]MCU4571087.1 hypothetical protein [Acinetobacter ursingii]